MFEYKSSSKVYTFFINSLSSGGAERVIVNLANKMGKKARIILLWPDVFFPLSKDVECKVLLKKKGFLPLDLVFGTIELIKYVKEEKLEEINSHLFWANYINVLSSLFTKHKTMCTHCVSYISKFSGFSKLIHYFLLKKLLNKADLHTFKSKDMMMEYKNEFGYSNIIPIPNPLDYNSVINKSQESSGFNFIEGIVYGVCVGRFHPTKNQIAVLNILQNLPDNYRVIFIGKANYHSGFESEVKSRNLTKKVIMLGEMKNPYPIIDKSDFCISLSLSEGFPNVLVESIALNTLPVFYDCHTGPKEIMSSSSLIREDDFSSGYLFELGFLINNLDCRLIANDIRQLIDSRVSIDQKAHYKFVNSLDLNLICEKYSSSLFEN